MYIDTNMEYRHKYCIPKKLLQITCKKKAPKVGVWVKSEVCVCKYICIIRVYVYTCVLALGVK